MAKSRPTGTQKAEARGYQRAVDALHNEADAAQLRSNDSYAEALESAADYLEALAATRPQEGERPNGQH